MSDLAYLIPAFPLIAFVVNIFFGRQVKHLAGWISVAASLGSCVFAFPAIQRVIERGAYEASWLWLRLGAAKLSFGYFIDPLAATLLFVVAVIGTLIQVYSIGYMHGDPRFSRFFAYVSLFMSAMLTLVIANNFLLFFMAWEVMGLCSYLLIGFWFEKNPAADAGRKAFLTTRVGDVGFFLGILFTFVALGTLNFSYLEAAVHERHAAPFVGVAALLIFCGTVGKSAQFPLHVWLPDAMEGPTPVSALIHAATMVAAGVYLIARSFPIFAAHPEAMEVVAWIGTLTAFMAAYIALTANDIKKVLAYSTISQLGYMVAALGLGGFTAGTFHLMTHAFFKALLFLGAGSVIHGTGTQDMRDLGGLFGKMKHTAITFLIASLAIAGVPPLSGFWSKEEILTAAEGHPVIFGVLVLTAFMTAFYMFRMVFMTFFGKPRSEKIHAHESPAVMTLPLWVLAAGAVLVGIPGSPWMHNWFQEFLHAPAHHGSGHHGGHLVLIASLSAGFGGILLAALLYLAKNNIAATLARVFAPLYALSVNKFWIDEIYSVIIIRPFLALGRFLFSFDQKLIDGAVNGTGRITVRLSAVKLWFDQHIVDGLVNLVGYVTQFCSAFLRKFQTGFVQHYLLVLFAGVLAIMFFKI